VSMWAGKGQVSNSGRMVGLGRFDRCAAPSARTAFCAIWPAEIDVKRTMQIPRVDAVDGRAADPLTRLRSVTSTLAI
jgi:hypothetical protein